MARSLLLSYSVVINLIVEFMVKMERSVRLKNE